MNAPDLSQAVTEARAAEAHTAQVAQILAVLQATQAANAAPAPAACSCSHSHQQKPGVSGKTVAAWLAGGAVCATTLTGMFLAIALVAGAVTICGCVGYLLVREIRKGK